MRLRVTTSLLSLPLFVLLPLGLSSCSGVIDPGITGSASGGADTLGSGGGFVGSGGAALGNSGGAPIGSSGGAPGSGGGLPGETGGAGTGGVGTGGGDSTGSGGVASGGGDIYAFVEDPGAACSVGTMPEFSSLTSNPKLPDPFKKMDGTQMTSKSEWLCRREEILQQGYEFIYGKKPMTPASAVSGTVSNSQISVSVTDGGTGTFMATVKLPSSGSAPYPAVITYSAVSAADQFTSNGVAVINFDPYSVGSESAIGTGAFYSVYGKNHEAGLLTAWAWGVSRIIDVIAANPGTIEPTKIAVTGCSRFGKGAFVAGAFDARVALTIPMESGVGGTPALRLIGPLDGSLSNSEWPYHAISYEPWFSPTKLGQFTTGNSSGADHTDKLPVDIHEMLALVVPRGLYIWDNPSTNYNGLDKNAAYITGSIGAMLFDALGVKDNLTYQGASGSHCQGRTAYNAPLVANIKKFLLGDDSATTGTFATDFPSPPSPDSHMDFTIPTLSGDL